MKKIIISDIGSTKTKSILIVFRENEAEIVCTADSSTTVEKPKEDVIIGICETIEKMQRLTKIKLIEKVESDKQFQLVDDVIFLATSSAGGGLQILVIGLTKEESAEAAKKAAYGAGGVILDVLAVNDQRSIVEQMKLISSLKPDIILFSGGLDGGATVNVVRLAEIINASNPKPKFSQDNELPMIFAGNKDIEFLIRSVFQDKYDLHIVPNIRPNLKEENLKPASVKIHNLFMENVMAQAPGYHKILDKVNSDIIPTPVGVKNTLKHISDKYKKNIVAIDIGGATTDVFSNILGYFFRTVSANFGMSYSISNVMFEAGFEKVHNYPDVKIDENLIRDYVSNKMLYPEFIPVQPEHFEVEHLLARLAIGMSKEQHFRMHFKTQRRNLLEKIKDQDFMKVDRTFYFEKEFQARKFNIDDVDIIIGMGGVFSHLSNKLDAAIILHEGVETSGITEIWRDERFLSPHFGKLLEYEKSVAETFIEKECFEKIALIIRPSGRKVKKKKKVLKLYSLQDKHFESVNLEVEEFQIFYPKKQISLIIEMEKGFLLNNKKRVEIKTQLPVIVDTRGLMKINQSINKQEKNDFKSEKQNNFNLEEYFKPYIKKFNFVNPLRTLKRELPYKGLSFVKVGDRVSFDDIIAENSYEPPRIYIISSLIKKLKINKNIFCEALNVSIGQELKIGQKIFKNISHTLVNSYSYFTSPVRGIITSINYDVGTLILREIQDYSLKPVKIDVASKIGINPKHIRSYLVKNKNSFVYAGEIVAKNIARKHHDPSAQSYLCKTPVTGTITDIDQKNGTITVHYNRKPYKLKAAVDGLVTNLNEGKSVEISYKGFFLNGIIGFGKERLGRLIFQKSLAELDVQNFDSIVVYPASINFDSLKFLEERKIKGLIVPSIRNIDLVKFLKTEIGIALTGKEEIPFSIIITEGFGNFEFKPGLLEILKKSINKKVFIDPHTQIRAGVVRPKIIISD